MLKLIKLSITLPSRLFGRLIDLIFPKNLSAWSAGKTRGRAKIETEALNYHEVSEELEKKEYEGKTYAGIAYFMKYKNPLVKKAIWQFKYYLNPQAFMECTYILYDELVAEVSDRVTRIPFRGPSPLIHCPSSTYFKGEKKFDHMKELTLALENLQDPAMPFFISCIHAILPNMRMDPEEYEVRPIRVDAPNAVDAKAQHMGTRKERFEWARQRFIISEKFEKYLMENLSPRKYPEKFTRHTGAASTANPVTASATSSGTAPLSLSVIYCIDDVITTGASLNAISKLIERKFDVKVKAFCLCH
jgi:hypothetical protein